MAENMQGYDKTAVTFLEGINWFGPSLVNPLSFSKFIYRKCSRAGLAGANRNSYRKFLTIEIALREHTQGRQEKSITLYFFLTPVAVTRSGPGCSTSR